MIWRAFLPCAVLFFLFLPHSGIISPGSALSISGGKMPHKPGKGPRFAWPRRMSPLSLGMIIDETLLCGP